MADKTIASAKKVEGKTITERVNILHRRYELFERKIDNEIDATTDDFLTDQEIITKFATGIVLRNEIISVQDRNIAQLKEKLAQIEKTQLKEKNIKIEKTTDGYEDIVTELKMANRDLKEEITDLKNDINILNKNNDNLNNEIFDQKKEINFLNKSSGDLESEIIDLNKEINILKERVIIFSDSNYARLKATELLEEQISALKKQRNSAVNELYGTVMEKVLNASNIEETQDAVQEAVDEIARLKEIIYTAQGENRLSIKDKLIDDRTEEVLTLRGDKERMAKELSAQNEKNQTNIDIKDDIICALDELREEYAELMVENSELKNENTKLHEFILQLQSIIDKLNDKLNSKHNILPLSQQASKPAQQQTVQSHEGQDLINAKLTISMLAKMLTQSQEFNPYLNSMVEQAQNQDKNN